MHFGILKTPLGALLIQDDSKNLLKVVFLDSNPINQENPSPLTKRAKTQLQEYFKGQRKSFDLPLNPQGSEFCKKVWYELCKIPYGKTKSYKDIAKAISKENAARAIGSANHKNQILIIIPCHRVISTNGNINGYAAGIHKKEFLLNLEAKNS